MQLDHQQVLEMWKRDSKTVSLIPLDGKKPIEKGWQKWCQEIRPFDAKDFQDHNAGMACGPASGVIVLDVDHISLFRATRATRKFEMPETRQVQTGSGKPHYYFKYPGDGKVYGNKSFKRWGFDIRGVGGQVVYPGSVHPETGKPYRVVKDIAPAPAPQWLLDLYGESVTQSPSPSNPTWSGTIQDLPVKEETKGLILQGVPVGQRSEAIMTVCNALVWSNLSDPDICSIFESYPIGEKYREKGRSKEKWLGMHINKARALIVNRATTTIEKKQKTRSKPLGSAYNTTDMGNAERFTYQHGDNVRYCHPWGQWLLWDGVRWQPDQTQEIKRKARATVRGIYREAAKIKNKSDREAMAKHALKCESEAKIRAMLSLAESEEGIPVTPGQLDTEPMLLNCKNGTVDLRSGKLLSHNRAHLITKLAPVAYDPQAACPLWLKFLADVFGGNTALIYYMQRATGYALTGDTREQCLFYMHGPGANGKSTYMETIRSIVGDYAQQADFETFLQQKNQTIRNDLAKFKGARLVSAIEADASRRMAESLVKQVTGNDTITARRLYQEYFDFKPEFKIFLAANSKVQVHGTDYAIWRRIRLIPFNVIIAEDKQDKDLPNKLQAELPGILAWAVQGCLRWQKEGLGTPDEVRTATQGYRDEMDILSGFLMDRCLLHDRLTASAKELYAAYTQWCEESGETPIKQRTFGTRLSGKGLTKGRGTGGVRRWHGIGLVTQVTDSDGCSGKLPTRENAKGLYQTNRHHASLTSLPPNTPGHLVGHIDPELAHELYGKQEDR
ncbi:MAG: phage/plasmid primase, P4 family [Thermodesulfobacteriota bacterium]|nr:phage/plasmid primase, P4 family [Thermodesulfobacteriota bacterium]